MSGKAFFDSTALVYAISNDPRAAIAWKLLERGGSISVQVLNEFAAVTRRKLKWPWDKVNSTLADIRDLCEEPLPITLELHEAGLKLAARYKYQIYDSLIIASALAKDCDVLYSEDMQDGQRIDSLTIRNPFKLLTQ